MGPVSEVFCVICAIEKYIFIIIWNHVLAKNKTFPDITKRNDAVICRYTVGYGSSASDVPEIIKQAILLTIGNFYENRNSVIIGRIATELPQNVKWLLDTYKVQIVGWQ